jgi:hypothetical protein
MRLRVRIVIAILFGLSLAVCYVMLISLLEYMVTDERVYDRTPIIHDSKGNVIGYRYPPETE